MNSIESAPPDQIRADNAQRRFAFISTCPEPWGGSEELWAGAALSLATRGHRVAVFKTNVERAHPQIQRLLAAGCRVNDLFKARLPVIGRAVNAVATERFQITPHRRQMLHVAFYLKWQRPDLVVISQGDNYDALQFGNLCRLLKMPYVLVSQKAPDIFWPPDDARHDRRQAFQSARCCYFVSRHNLRVTQEQLGCALPNAEVISNPFGVQSAGPLPWPHQTDDGEFRLACVARLYVLDKGQDILLRVLSQPKWKARKLRVNFFGQGVNRQGLIELAQRLKVDKVSFCGHTGDVAEVWRDHHALVLPSRAEGLPLSLVEAMMCGRAVIATDVGGNAEVLQNEVSGFLASGANETAFDEAMERAWQRREEWQQMGKEAERRIRQLVPPNPAQLFSDKLLSVTSDAHKN